MSRRNAPESSTFPAEIIKCRLGSRIEKSLYCKYGADIDNAAHGHRGAVAYEAGVYRNLLRTCGLTTAKFYGNWSDGEHFCLILQFLDGGTPVHKATFPSAMIEAARWIGHFHAGHVGRGP